MNIQKMNWNLYLMLMVLVLGGFTSLIAQPLQPDYMDDFTGKPRVIALTDIGNEPDDQMSFVR